MLSIKESKSKKREKNSRRNHSSLSNGKENNKTKNELNKR